MLCPSEPSDLLSGNISFITIISNTTTQTLYGTSTPISPAHIYIKSHTTIQHVFRLERRGRALVGLHRRQPRLDRSVSASTDYSYSLAGADNDQP